MNIAVYVNCTVKSDTKMYNNDNNNDSLNNSLMNVDTVVKLPQKPVINPLMALLAITLLVCILATRHTPSISDPM